MDLRTYFWQHLDKEERQAYAAAAGYDADYVRVHLIPNRVAPRKNPTKLGIYRLADASDGHVSRAEAVQFFFPSDELRHSPQGVDSMYVDLPDR